MRVLDLFSGIGGFSLGLERAGMKTVAFCEIDPFCRRVLAKHWPGVPIYDDVRTLPAIGGIDIVCGGFPCQPFSHAGKQLGAEDDRHLWPAMLDVVRRERPAWVFGENVVGIVNMELDKVLADLDGIGYACRAFDIPAAAVDAPHIRRRIWIVARDRDRDRQSTVPADDEVEGLRGDMADADEPGPQRHRRLRERAGELASRARGRAEPSEWLAEPAVGRVAHGISARVDRLSALGNAVVPQIVEIIGRAILEMEHGHAGGRDG